MSSPSFWDSVSAWATVSGSGGGQANRPAPSHDDEQATTELGHDLGEGSGRAGEVETPTGDPVQTGVQTHASVEDSVDLELPTLDLLAPLPVPRRRGRPKKATASQTSSHTLGCFLITAQMVPTGGGSPCQRPKSSHVQFGLQETHTWPT